MILLQPRFVAQPNATLFLANQLIDAPSFDVQSAARRFSNSETSRHLKSRVRLNAVQSNALQPAAYLIDKTALGVTSEVIAKSIYQYRGIADIAFD